MERKESNKDFTLRVPLDASDIEGFTPEQRVKVVLKKRDGTMSSPLPAWSEPGTWN